MSKGNFVSPNAADTHPLSSVILLLHLQLLLQDLLHKTGVIKILPILEFFLISMSSVYANEFQ